MSWRGAWIDFALYSIDLQLMDQRSDPNSDQQTKTSVSEFRFAVTSNRWKDGKAAD